MEKTRDRIRRQRVADLTRGFDRYLAVFEEANPFSRYGQWDYHARTIDLRRSHRRPSEAVSDPTFVSSLHQTLKAWGIGIRGSNLLDLDGFGRELARWSEALDALNGVTIGSAGPAQRRAVWRLIEEIGVTDNKARVVALTKTLHHLLPDLVMPIDRAYTGAFFAWHVPEFQSRQKAIFETAWDAAVSVAGSVDLEAHVGVGEWNTSVTKVIDNAIVGYCIAENVGKSNSGVSSPSRPSGRPRRERWTLEELRQDLATFADDLESAGLKKHTIDTYVGRADTFLRWLAGTYEPGGPR